MPSLSSIVNVTISRQTKTVTAAGFGVPMFLGLHKGFTERIRSYTDLDGVAEDFASNTNEYAAAEAIFAQSPTVVKMMIGRQGSTVATVTPVVADSTAYTVTVNGTDYTYTTGTGEDATDISAGLAALIDENEDGCTATAPGSVLILTGSSFSFKTTTNMSATYTTTETAVDALDAIVAVDSTWYGLLTYTKDTEAVIDIADWVEASKKLYVIASSHADAKDEAGAADTSSPAQALKAGSYTRSAYLYSDSAADDAATNDVKDFPDAAWAGLLLATDPGSATWKFKTLTGITADVLSPTESNNVLNKKGNTYETVAGIDMTAEGTVASGEFIDVIRDIDWLTSRIQERIFTRFVNMPKIPYTQHGLAIIEGELRAQLLQAIDRGVIADDTPFTVTMPTIADISSIDRTARNLPDVKFTARLAGSVHNTVISGVITA